MKLILAASLLFALDMAPLGGCNCGPRDQSVALPMRSDASDMPEDAGSDAALAGDAAADAD